MHPFQEIVRIEVAPKEYLEEVGNIFAIFNAATQDSGNISYGVEVDGSKFFVKTAGNPEKAHLDLVARIDLLRNGARLNHECPHPTMPALRNVIESQEGPMLVYDWVEGDLLGVPKEKRDDPGSAFQRFRALPVEKILDALGTLFDLHDQLAQSDWVASDFYDGSLIYDFLADRLHVVDLDHYHQGPFQNTMGSMFGSSRFMAPEETRLGATIDQRTTVFTMGRTAFVFLSEGDSFRGPASIFEVARKACEPNKEDRWQSVREFWDAWCAARPV